MQCIDAFQEQYDHIVEIFFYDVMNLQFFEKHILNTDGRIIQFKPALEIDLVAEVQGIVEYINKSPFSL